MNEIAPATLIASRTSRNRVLALLRAVVQHHLARVGLVIIAVLCVFAVFAPVLAPYSPYDQDLYSVLAAPSAQHWLGTDNLGRDLFSRLLYGARVSLFVGIGSTALSAAFGVVIGLLAGFEGGAIDAIIMRLPGIRLLYQGWKQIALTPGGTEGTFSRVVLIPDETGTMRLMGFCSGRIIEADEPCYCVFIPSSPNPITGRLYFVRTARCQFIEMTTEEAFKVILSTGNYVPPIVAIESPPVAHPV